VYRTSGFRLGRPGGRNRMSEIDDRRRVAPQAGPAKIDAAPLALFLYRGLVMAESKTKRHLPDIAKNVLQDPDRTREQAAWELLYAVQDLFPERIQGLRDLGERLASDYNGEADESDDHNKQVEDQFTRAVRDWAATNRISCAAVDDAAAKYVGGTPSVDVFVDADVDDPDFIDRTPSITAGPYNETRQEFLKRAGKYYDDLAQRYVEQGATRGPVKRDGGDHFRYLAAHLVGGFSFADIAGDPARFSVAAASKKTVAGEARKTARLIGLALRTVPGPRPGSRSRRALQRVRR
jgi:hypothetical protein